MSATNANVTYDLVSWAKQGLNGKSVTPAMLLAQSNEPVNDAIWLPGNLPTGHRITQVTGLPTTYTRQIGQAVQTSRDQNAQIDEGMALFEQWAEYDMELLRLEGDKGQFLYNRSIPAMESMVQKFMYSFWYGDPSVDPTQFLGLAPRYSTVSSSNAANYVNVVDGGGSGSVNTSMWLVTWAPTALHGIFPTGTSAGIEHFVNDDVVIQGSTGLGGTRLRAHQEQWTWRAGLALWDWRWCARLCNIDVTNLRAQSGATDLTEGLIDLLGRMPSLMKPPSETGNPMTSNAIPGKQAIYCNRTVAVALRKQMLNKTNNMLSMTDWYGHKVMSFDGIPIRVSDQILNTEARVT